MGFKELVVLQEELEKRILSAARAKSRRHMLVLGEEA